ncbi:MAG: hypothetical protein ACLUD2_21340 [Clostridium sp.]
MALAEKIMMMARTSPDEIMYDVYVGGIGYTMPEFYNDVYKYVSSEGLAELVRRTRDTVPDNIAYLRERGQDAEKINMFFRDMDARKRMERNSRSSRGSLCPHRSRIISRSTRRELIRAERCSVLPHVWESPESPPWALETRRMTSA